MSTWDWHLLLLLSRWASGEQLCTKRLQPALAPEVVIKDFRTDVALAEMVLSVKTFRGFALLQHVCLLLLLVRPALLFMLFAVPVVHFLLVY